MAHENDHMEDFYQPYANAQVVTFPEKARIEQKRLLIFRYQIGPGLVEALSRRIKETKNADEMIEELILDQNNLSDAGLASILEALYQQGREKR